MRALRPIAVLCGALALVVPGGADVEAGAASRARVTVTEGTPSTSGSAATGSAVTRIVTLVTGERVAMTRGPGGRLTAALDAPESSTRRRSFHTLTTGTAQYVIPDEALPYLGHPLDLSLFTVAATDDPAAATPPAKVTVEWAPGATRHAIPGLTPLTPLTPPPAGDASTARISSPTALGAALATGSQALRGIRTIRAASAAGAGQPPATESPHFTLATLIVTGLDRQGATAAGGSVSVVNADDAARFVGLSGLYQGTVSFSVPEGHYSLTVEVSTPASGGAPASDALVVLPDVSVSAPQTVVTADARTARTLVPVPATPLPSQLEQFSAALDRVTASGMQVGFTAGFVGSAPELYVTAVPAVRLGALHWYTYYRLDGTAPSTVDGLPYLYDVEFPADADGIPDHFPASVDVASMATLDAAYHSDVAGHAIDTFRGSFLPWETFSLRPVSPATAPLRRTEYVTGRPDIAWVGSVVWHVDDFNGLDEGPRTVFRAGQRTTDPYLRAPLVPGSDGGTAQPSPCTACRQGSMLGLAIQPWMDSGGHAVGQLTASASLDVSTQTRLYADGTLVQQSLLPVGVVALPASASALRLTLDTTKSAAWTTTATHTSTTWEWRSTSRVSPLPAQRTCPDGTQACGFEPLLFADYDLGADLGNALPAGQPAPLTIRVHRQSFDTTAAVETLTLDVSTDDGATWNSVPVHAGDAGVYSATLPASAISAGGTGFLSVRVHASALLGEVLDQTVIRAVRITSGT